MVNVAAGTGHCPSTTTGFPPVAARFPPGAAKDKKRPRGIKTRRGLEYAQGKLFSLLAVSCWLNIYMTALDANPHLPDISRH
jgi:hypothetical protein